MVPRTESKSDSLRRIAEFYDALAPDYDRMTGFEARFAREMPFFRSIVKKFGIRTALDAGCGSGFHSFLLAQLGVAVIAADASAEMLRRFRKHARDFRVQIPSVQSTFQELKKSISKQHDALFCLGNSLAHILRSDELVAALRSFAGVLRPGGILVIQLLNYERILERRERIQSVKDSSGKTFVRFYDFDHKGIKFNIATLERSRGRVEQRLQSVRLRPWLHDEILSALARTGFIQARTFGGISMERFSPRTSKDLVVLARRDA
jgi:glycine/sarcosine N-methyltransferase